MRDRGVVVWALMGLMAFLACVSPVEVAQEDEREPIPCVLVELEVVQALNVEFTNPLHGVESAVIGGEEFAPSTRAGIEMGFPGPERMAFQALNMVIERSQSPVVPDNGWQGGSVGLQV